MQRKKALCKEICECKGPKEGICLANLRKSQRTGGLRQAGQEEGVVMVNSPVLDISIQYVKSIVKNGKCQINQH